MIDRPKESDWKRYSAIVGKVRDRYLAQKNTAFVNELTRSDKPPTERFWDTLEAMRREAKLLDRSLGRDSRSQMMINMLGMINIGMLRIEDLDGFSEDLADRLRPFIDPDYQND